MDLHFDRDGRPLGLMEWVDLTADPDYKRVAKTDRDGCTVSTVWLGTNTAWRGGPPRFSRR